MNADPNAQHSPSHSATSSPSHSEDFSHRWYVLASVAMGIFLGTIDGGIVNIALPTLTRELHASIEGVRWTVLAYMITLASLMLPIGFLGDKLGKKNIYNAGFVIFTIASALCGIAPNLATLVTFRILQAIGAAMMTSLGMALVTESFPPNQRGKALGITGSIVSVGIIAGPAIGGFMVEHFNWRSLFYVNVPIGIAGSIMAAKFIPNIKHQQRTNRSYMYILRSPQLMLPLATGFLFFAITSGLNFLLPFYLENVLNLTSSRAGIIMGITPVVLGALAPVSGILSDRIGTTRITIAGSIIAALGFSILLTLEASTQIHWVVLALIPPALGLALFQTANNSSILSSVPRHQTGITSSFVGFSRTLGFASGIGIFSTLFSVQLSTSGMNHTEALKQVGALFPAIHTVLIFIACTGILAAAIGVLNKPLQKALARKTISIANQETVHE